LWNEIRKDPRWGQKTHTIVLKYHIPTGKKTRITRYGENLYPIEIAGDTVAVIHYFETGGNHIDFISSETGKPYLHWPVPDSLQCVEIAHIGNDIYAAALSSEGFGIWKVHGDEWTNVLKPQPVEIAALDHDGTALVFESNWNGEWEYYRYNLEENRLYQVSSTLFGGNDFSFMDNGDLVFSQITKEGLAAYRTKAEDLVFRPIKWEEYRHNPVADKLSLQEKKLCSVAANVDTLAISAPKRYVKGGHAIRFHSWAPFYVDIDAISSLSFENVKNIASLGAMGFFQNTMSTFSGYIGYKAAPDANGKWYHSGHLNLTYSGLYPVFELLTHFNERSRIEYVDVPEKNKTVSNVTESPYFNLSFRSYVPLEWNSGIHYYGVLPSVGLNYANDKFTDSSGEQQCLLFNAGVRTYLVERTPMASIYPRWGMGLEVKWLDPLTYVYMYGYLPGACCGQGFKLTALAQFQTRSDAIFIAGYANLMPRGMNDWSGIFFEGEKGTVEYAVPFPMGDWHISDAFFCSRGVFTPHFDFSHVNGTSKYVGGWLYSAGATLDVEFDSFFWVRCPFTIGVTASYNWGSATYTQLNPGKNYYIGATASFDLPL